MADRRASLGTKLVCFSTLLTVAAVSVAFVVLSFSVKRYTKRLLAGTLARHQATLSSLQQRGLDELLRTSTLMTDSPTLRAAMETYAGERSGASAGLRPDLLATIQNEADKVASGLGHDLLVLTDATGEVLARSGTGPVPAVGDDLLAHPIVRGVLAQRHAVDVSNFAVLELGGRMARVGCVPIVLQGFTIGTLTVGDWLDAEFAEAMARSFDCDVVIAEGTEVVATTLAGPIAVHDLDALSTAGHDAAPGPHVAEVSGEEYVAASATLGRTPDGHDIVLYLLSPLGPQLASSQRYLLLILLFCGVWAVILAGTTAWWMSRSLLRPLQSFVGFMRAVASSGDHARRFQIQAASPEVETLNHAYSQLMDSLVEHERRMLESAREELSRLERLKESEKLAALGRTLSGAAHEINNPLTGVIGNVDMMLRDERLDPQTRQRLALVQREGQRIAQLVRNVLKIAHRETGETTIADVRQAVRETVEARRHDFTSSGMRIELDLDVQPVRVRGNDLELHQLFLNIVNNAYDALKDSGPFPRLSIGVVADDKTARITFSDNGPGMHSPDRVFEHFYTTKPVGQGTGLGLSICHAIVQKHAGSIAAENLPGGGARFTIELPRTTELEAPCRLAEAATEQAPAAEGRLDARVLVVDDESSIVELQREILEDLGAEVVGVASGAAAIEQLREYRFDLIVSDVKMPGSVSGRDLYRWVAENLREGSHGFVFITGDTAGDGSRDFAERVGARCVMKPFSTEDYVRAVREAYHGIRRAR